MSIQPTFGTLYTAKEVRRVTAGGDNYIRTKRNIVKGLALTHKFNPDLPKAAGEPGVIAFGTGSRVVAGADRFNDACNQDPSFAVPLFVKKHTDAWQYFGQYRAIKLSRDTTEIRRYGAKRPYPTAGVLFIEPISEPEILVSRGGFADPETRKKAEKAAIDFVTCDLERRGFQVKDVSRENRGFDLRAVSASGELLAEVKGTSCAEPRFYLTRREFRCSQERKEWKLFVVCDVLSEPVLHEFTSSEMRNHFKLDPLAWDCTRM